MATPLVRTATARDAQSIRVLLELDGLPTADLVSSQPEFIVACQDTRIIGARAADVTELILLTQTAKPFFARQNYRTIERESVPPAMLASEEFRSLCPESATCMAKTLR
jgi:hypothetical protein